MEGKTNFWGAYRLSGTGIVECLEIIDVACNLKQFDGLTWLTLISPIYYNRSVLVALPDSNQPITLHTKILYSSGNWLTQVYLEMAIKMILHKCFLPNELPFFLY